VKVYPLNEDQLSYIGVVKGLAGLCFTLAAASGGFAVNIYKDLQIQGQVPKDVTAYWDAIRNVSGTVAIILAVLGTIFFGIGHYRLKEIKKRTQFDVS